MENWGLVTGRETRLIVDPNYCGDRDILALTMTHAHELSHLVTCLFLNNYLAKHSLMLVISHHSLRYILNMKKFTLLEVKHLNVVFCYHV